MEEKFFTIKQVAELLGVTRKAIYDWMRDGRLQYVIVGERRRIKKSDLDAFIKVADANTAGKQLPDLAATMSNAC